MKLIFKQFLKTFRKNILLIIGLSALVGVLSFLLSASINITQSFNHSLNKLDQQGKKANVVSNTPSDFGYLDFSWKQANYEVSTYMSSLSLQKDASGNYTRAANTFFPYSSQELKSRTSSFGISTGISVNKNATEIQNMFTLDINNPKSVWNYNYGLTVGQPIQITFNPKKATAYSFVDDSGNISFNPKILLLNQYGIPFSTFQKGVMNDELKLITTFDDYNDNVIETQPEIYDEQGYGILQNFFNRSKKNIYSLHNSASNLIIDIENYGAWKNNQFFVFDVFSRFIEKVNTTPYIFEINLDNSTGPVKTFIQTHPELFQYAFDSIFNANHYSRTDVPGGFDADIVSNISLIQKNQNTYQIQLAISDEVFIDYSSNVDHQEQIASNKRIYLNNFKGYLSSEFSNKLYELFEQKIEIDLKNQGITMQMESEYYYRDSGKNIEYLYTGKNSDSANSLVVYDGNSIYDNKTYDQIYSDLTTRLPYGKISKQNIYALKEILYSVPDATLSGYDNGLPNKMSTSTSDYSWFQLLRFCAYHVVEELKQDTSGSNELPQSIYHSAYFKLLSKLCSNFFNISFNGNQINVDTALTYDFTSLFFKKAYSVLLLENFMCVISNTYADVNKKKFLPTKVNNKVDETWTIKLDEIGNDASKFEQWISSISNTENMELTFSQIKKYFTDKQNFFNIWVSYLSDDYKIIYKETFFLISGFGLSPDFAFPVISPTSPIPDPNTQVIVYLNNMTYNTLKISDVNKTNYYSFYSVNKSDNQIINSIKSCSSSLIGSDIFKPSNINDAVGMGSIYLRSFFPYKIRSLLIIFTIIGVIFLVLLSLVVIYLILKSFIKNMVEPIALCIANGISMWRIILACLTNFAIFLTPVIIIAYIISYFTQPFLLSLFSSIWLIPGTFVVPFTPLILIPLVVCILLAFSGILSLVIYNKFKKPIPQIISNKQDVTCNRFTKLISNSKVKLHSILKLSLGFTSINLGRLGLISILGSIALGAISSSIIINDKFNTAQTLTNESRNYEFQYDLANIYESTGLYKPQKFTEIGMEDKTVGINSIYQKKSVWDSMKREDKYPYYYEQMQIKKIPEHGNESQITNINGKYLSNIVMPSYKIYQQINSRNLSTFFNSAASLFLLDLSITFSGLVTLNIWDFIKVEFPDWLVSQLEQQAGEFQKAIMSKYGEWYYKFINLKNETEYLTNDEILTLSNVTNNMSGYYYATATVGSIIKTEYTTKPYYVWVDNDQWYWSDVNDIHSRYNLSSGGNVDLVYNKATDFYNTKNGTQTNISDKNANIEWKFVPAFDKYHELDETKISNASASTAWDDIRFSDAFLEFITTIYGDEEVSKQDSKISFGIVPFDKEIEETYTKVTGRISGIRDLFNQLIEPTKPNIEIMGIKPDSDYIVLKDYDGNNISNLISSNSLSDTIDIIINEGASLDYNLKVGSEFEFNVSNNSLVTSYDLMKNIIELNTDPINTRYKFKVVGINQDSFGAKFYINQNIANEITSLSKMKVYTQMVDKNFETNIIREESTDLSQDFIPFNGIFSKNPELLISYKSIPFYTFASIWNTWTSTSNILNLDMYTIFDSIVTTDETLLKDIGNYIKDEINSNFNNTNDLIQLRKNIVSFLVDNYGQSSFLSATNDMNIRDLLSVALATAVPSVITNNMFVIISNLVTTLIIILIAVLVPLLIFVTLVTSFSIVGDLTKNLALMKILGYSNRNILITVALMYIPVFIIATLAGLGIMLGINFGLQYLIYNLTSIFITQAINIWVFMIATGIIALIFAIAALLTLFISRKQGLENNLKF